MTLEYMAMHWLRFEKSCPVALFERNPRYGCGLPDVLGITQSRYLYEIEIKRSVADFRANSRKPFHAVRNIKGDDSQYPALFWFLTPADLAEKVRPLLPEWAGLMRGPNDGQVQQLHVVVEAPRNPKSRRLTTKECVKLTNCMANQIYSFAKKLSLRKECEDRAAEYEIEDYAI